MRYLRSRRVIRLQRGQSFPGSVHMGAGTGWCIQNPMLPSPLITVSSWWRLLWMPLRESLLFFPKNGRNGLIKFKIFYDTVAYYLKLIDGRRLLPLRMSWYPIAFSLRWPSRKKRTRRIRYIFFWRSNQPGNSDQ